MNVAIIGAGPAGLTAGYQLAAAGHQVVVFEGSDAVGGMSRSFDLWGQRVDLGPHRFFSKDPRVNRLWLKVIGQDYRMIQRKTRILYRQHLYDYPLRAANVLKNSGVRQAVTCVGSYAVTRMTAPFTARQEDTFEDWVVARFGRRLFEMFFKAYSEKLWGISCRELNAEFASQRIRTFSLAGALMSALGLGRQKHRTLADTFAYPLQGNGTAYQRMAAAIVEQGGQVRLATPVRRILVEHDTVRGVVLDDGSTQMFDHVVSTMPLTLMVRSLPNVPTAVIEATHQLHFRNTVLVYLLVDRSDLFPDQWLYVHSPELQMGRITNFRNWAPEICREQTGTILAVEYWCNDEDPDWLASEQTLIERASREIVATGLVRAEEIRAGKVVRVPRCYPVYTRDYKTHLAAVVEFLKRYRNLWPIGRYGSFKYNNQDHSILMGILAAETILGQAAHDLWQVNSDDTYQESSSITADGLIIESASSATA